MSFHTLQVCLQRESNGSTNALLSVRSSLKGILYIYTDYHFQIIYDGLLKEKVSVKWILPTANPAIELNHLTIGSTGDPFQTNTCPGTTSCLYGPFQGDIQFLLLQSPSSRTLTGQTASSSSAGLKGQTVMPDITRWTNDGSASGGSCMLPADFSSYPYAFAMGDQKLGPLAYTGNNPWVCGQLFEVDCTGADFDGSGPVNKITAGVPVLGLAMNANPGGGVDLVETMWNSVTGGIAGTIVRQCKVTLSKKTPLPGQEITCYHRPTSDSATNNYYRSIGVFNTGGRKITSATLDGKAYSAMTGPYQTWYNGPFKSSAVLSVTFDNEDVFTTTIDQCKNQGLTSW
jgi:hypothetical protein